MDESFQDPASAQRTPLRDPFDMSGHLSYEQIAAYLDGEATPTERTQLERHTKSCGRCRLDLQDLADFTTELEGSRPVEDAPPVPIRRMLRWGWLAREGTRVAAVAAVLAGLAVFGPAVTRRLRENGNPDRVDLRSLTTQLHTIEQEQSTAAAQWAMERQELVREREDTARSNRQLAALVSQITLEWKRTRSLTAVVAAREHATGVLPHGSSRDIASDARSAASGSQLSESNQTARHKAAVRQQMASAEGGSSGTSVSMGVANQGKGSFRLLYPVQVQVDTTRPVFRWMPLAAGERQVTYVVKVFSMRSKQLEQGSPEITETKWQPKQDLLRGGFYRWVVYATVAGDGKRLQSPVGSDITFTVMPDADDHRGARSELSHLQDYGVSGNGGREFRTP